MDEKIIYAVGGAVAGILAGGGGVYLYMARKWENEFVKELDKAVAAETAATKKFYSALQKTDYPTPADLAAEMLEKSDGMLVVQEIVETQVYESDEPDTPEELVLVSKNVFTNYANNSTWDADAEEAKRDPAVPYVLSSDEFFENEGDRVQTQLVYFAEDDVLADLNDKPVDEAIVGPDNLQKFGHGSGDPNIVYIRNEVLDIELEIMYAEGKYSEQVHGFVQHSASPGRTLRKFRLEDET